MPRFTRAARFNRVSVSPLSLSGTLTVSISSKTNSLFPGEVERNRGNTAVGILIVAANFRTRNIRGIALFCNVVDEFRDNERLIRLLLHNPTAFRKYYVGTREIEEIEKGNVINTW